MGDFLGGEVLFARAGQGNVDKKCPFLSHVCRVCNNYMGGSFLIAQKKVALQGDVFNPHGGRAKGNTIRWGFEVEKPSPCSLLDGKGVIVPGSRPPALALSGRARRVK